MFRPILRRNLCQQCYKRFNNYNIKPFHSTRPIKTPLFPLPVVLLSMMKTGKLVSFISFSSKTSLTLLPLSFRRGGKAEDIAKVLTFIPMAGFTLLFIVGLDQAPNTSRLRLIYLSEEEEDYRVRQEMNQIFGSQAGLVEDEKSEKVKWLQMIVNNISNVAVDDIRDPVRKYSIEKIIEDEDHFRPPIPKRSFIVNLINDHTTVNAMCAGPYIVVYDKLLELMEYDSTRLAVILSHEIAHSIQRHFVEQHGLSSLMLMLGDITRGVFWIFTESLGPYINQVIHDYMTAFVRLETETNYNRQLEKEADLIGLKFLAKAGYDPTIAIDVWEKMEEYALTMQEVKPDNELINKVKSLKENRNSNENDYTIEEYVDSLVDSWFGSTHPPNKERIEYMKYHMDDAIRLYKESLEINGKPKEFKFTQHPLKSQNLYQSTLFTLSNSFNRLYYYFNPNKEKLIQ